MKRLLSIMHPLTEHRILFGRASVEIQAFTTSLNRPLAFRAPVTLAFEPREATTWPLSTMTLLRRRVGLKGFFSRWKPVGLMLDVWVERSPRSGMHHVPVGFMMS